MKRKVASLDVVCFGEILWDIYETEPRRLRMELGGAPANVATDLARVGIRSAVVGGIGRDRFGVALEKHLADDGVDTRHLIRLPNRTGLTFVKRDPRGEPSFLFYRHETADVSVRAEHITPAMGRARWGLVGTSTLMSPGLRRATSRFVKLLRREKGHLVVDLNVRAHMWRDKDEMKRRVSKLVRHATLIKASAADLKALSGSREKDGLLFLAKHAPGTPVVLTRGEKPAVAFFEGGKVEAPAVRTRCIDATGAGDAFIAGVLAVLVRKDARPGSAAWTDKAVWMRALYVGHGLGAKAVSNIGSVSGLTGLGAIRAKIGG